MNKRVVASVAAGAFAGGLLLASPGEAAEPADQACVGEFFSVRATSNPGLPLVPVLAQDPVGTLGLPSLGRAIQFLQAGVVPDGLFENTCNDNNP